jgi:hypothetical protein
MLSLRRSTEKTQLNFILKASFMEHQQETGTSFSENSNYFKWLPGFSYENQYRKGRRLNLRYNSGQNLPSVLQLMPVTNNINPSSLYQGNPELGPETNHNLFLEWSVFDQFSFTSFFSRLNIGYTDDKISLSRTVSDNLLETISPVNVPWHYFASGYVSFSFPIRPIGIKINTQLNEDWNRGINVVNAQDNITTSFTHSLNVNIENRLKEKWDALIGFSVSLTDAKHSIQELSNTRFLSTSYFTNLNYTPNESWNFGLRGRLTNYNTMGFADDFSIPLLDAEMNYYFLKGNKMVLSLEVRDIFNKNTGVRRISEYNYIMQEVSNTLGRYIMLSLKYRFNYV